MKIWIRFWHACSCPTGSQGSLNNYRKALQLFNDFDKLLVIVSHRRNYRNVFYIHCARSNHVIFLRRFFCLLCSEDIIYRHKPSLINIHERSKSVAEMNSLNHRVDDNHLYGMWFYRGLLDGFPLNFNAHLSWRLVAKDINRLSTWLLTFSRSCFAFILAFLKNERSQNEHFQKVQMQKWSVRLSDTNAIIIGSS